VARLLEIPDDLKIQYQKPTPCARAGFRATIRVKVQEKPSAILPSPAALHRPDVLAHSAA